MPRQPRVYSNTGIYHIMIRGINGEKIFNKEFYKTRILSIIKEVNVELEFYVIAYCIMNNHMHLLIKAGEEELTTLMKRLNIKYAMYYNRLEERYGHVFQDRYKSEAVEDERYYLGVLRYIHNNPIKAGVSRDIQSYKWSSASEYISHNINLISEKHLEEILSFFRNKDEFIKFHDIYDDNVYIDIKEEENENIQNIINNIIKNFSEKYGFTDQKQVKRKQKEELAEILLKHNICTIKEIADLCIMSVKNIVEINKKMQEVNNADNR